jgi:hypothetical protein
MTPTQAHWRILAVASLATVSLVGCGGSDGGTVPTPAPISDAIPFSIFATQAFSNSANSTPVSVNQDFTFDVNDEPAAFDALISSGTYGSGGAAQ